MIKHLARENDQSQEHHNKLWDEYEESKRRWEKQMNYCQQINNDL